jgi:hypothetical protein
LHHFERGPRSCDRRNISDEQESMPVPTILWTELETENVLRHVAVVEENLCRE